MRCYVSLCDQDVTPIATGTDSIGDPEAPTEMSSRDPANRAPKATIASAVEEEEDEEAALEAMRVAMGLPSSFRTAVPVHHHGASASRGAGGGKGGGVGAGGSGCVGGGGASKRSAAGDAGQEAGDGNGEHESQWERGAKRQRGKKKKGKQPLGAKGAGGQTV